MKNSRSTHLFYTKQAKFNRDTPDLGEMASERVPNGVQNRLERAARRAASAMPEQEHQSHHVTLFADLLFRANLQVLRLNVADAKDPVDKVQAERALRLFSLNAHDRQLGARKIALSLMDLAETFGVAITFSNQKL